MDEFEFIVSLLTPGSDLVTGDTTERFEAAFGRKGNDTFYVDDPGATGSLSQNIDFLFLDIFDNSEEEFEIILAIQDTQQGDNPLLILERNIPSVGADRVILGDKNQPYYTAKDPASLTTTNLLGFNEFAVLYDFSLSQDTIQLNGKRSDYRVVEVNGLQVEGIEQPFSGEFIFSLQQGTPDAVAFVINTPDVDIDLKGKYFEFVGDKPANKPRQKKIGQLGTTSNDISVGAAADASGNVYITGSTNGPLQGSNRGGSDAWVAKYDSSGNQVFLQQFGTSGNDGSNAVVTDSNGNFYLTGATEGGLFGSKQASGSDAWVAKYDSSGSLLWSRQFSATSADVLSNGSFGLDVDETGNVYVSGLAIKDNRNSPIFDFAVQDDAWVTKFDSNGNQQWFSELGSFFFDENYDLAVDKDGNSYLVGWTQGLVGQGGQESDPSRQLLKYDAWIAKFDTNGQRQWVQQLGSVDQGLEYGWGVDTDSQGNVYATGWTTGNLSGSNQANTSYDIWLSKFNTDGAQQWAKQFGSKGDDGMVLSDMEIDAQDNIFLIGYSNDKLGKGQKDKNYNAWVGRFDTEGNNKWIQQFGSKNDLDYATGVTTDDQGRLYVTGFTEGFLGSSSSGANGAAVDGWLAQLDVERGRLQRFNGSSDDLISIDNPGSIPTVDLGDDLVTDDRLPRGDNRIDLAPGDTIVDPRKIESRLGSLFDSNNSNSVTRSFLDAINNNNAPFLNPNDMDFMRGAIVET
ncbi:MAG: SBBP repeat-containing protein [Hydrococcus sp. Prado102]|nr:SBBP repeat-containing protein [Hydrococcus sp. Prado102]